MTSDSDQRPWGSYTVLDEATDYKVKRITVVAGKRLSYVDDDYGRADQTS
jgi:mannose-6-phosphate isomerase